MKNKKRKALNEEQLEKTSGGLDIHTEKTEGDGEKITIQLTKEEAENAKKLLKNGFPPPPPFGRGNHRHNHSHSNCPGGNCFDGSCATNQSSDSF